MLLNFNDEGGTIIAMAPVDGAWSSISFSAVGGIGQAAMANHGR